MLEASDHNEIKEQGGLVDPHICEKLQPADLVDGR
jgi:hypothetical protein